MPSPTWKMCWGTSRPPKIHRERCKREMAAPPRPSDERPPAILELPHTLHLWLRFFFDNIGETEKDAATPCAISVEFHTPCWRP